MSVTSRLHPSAGNIGLKLADCQGTLTSIIVAHSQAMDLKELAAARLVKLLYDATGIEPRRWSERRGLQRALSDKLGIDEGMLSKVRRGETPNVSLEAISKIWTRTGIRPGYFVEPMATHPTYTSFLTKDDPFTDLRVDGHDGARQQRLLRPRRISTAQEDLSNIADSIGAIAERMKRLASQDSSIENAARQGGFRSVRQGDELHHATKPSPVDGVDKTRTDRDKPTTTGHSTTAKRKR